MQTLTLEFNNERNFISVIEFIRKTDWFGKIRMHKTKKVKRNLPILRADSNANPEELFGIWKKRNLSKQQLREIAWSGH